MRHIRRSDDRVRLMKEREAALAKVHAAIDQGIADAEAGRTKPLEEVAERLISKYGEMAARQR